MRLIPHSANRFTKKSLTLSFIFLLGVVISFLRGRRGGAGVSDGGHQSIVTLPRIQARVLDDDWLVGHPFVRTGIPGQVWP